jgi:hypothetical protein
MLKQCADPRSHVRVALKAKLEEVLQILRYVKPCQVRWASCGLHDVVQPHERPVAPWLSVE